MNQEANQNPSQNQNANEQQEPEQVTIPAKDYQLLLDRLDELEANHQGNKSHDDVDDLYQEATQQQQQQEGQPPDLDNMTPSQLTQYIMQEVGKENQELQIGLHALRLSMEIDRFASKHEDFDDYQEDIQKIMIDNPRLSVAQAYKLAKSDDPQPKGEKDTQRRYSAVRERLPDTRRQPRGERPGAPQSTTKPPEPKTTVEAATRAFDEVVKGKNKVIEE